MPSSKTGRDAMVAQEEAIQICLLWARNGRDRVIARRFEGLECAVVPRISSWPEPHGRTLARAD